MRVTASLLYDYSVFCDLEHEIITPLTKQYIEFTSASMEVYLAVLYLLSTGLSNWLIGIIIPSGLDNNEVIRPA